jgi:peptide/nickel transport system permease protein
MKNRFRYWNFRLWFGLILLSLLLVAGFIFPFFMKGRAMEWNTYIKDLKPSAEHIMGTTSLGQDTFHLLTESIRNSFLIGFIVASLSSVIGILIGLLAGFTGGVLDRVITLVIDSFIVVPALPVLILISALLSASLNIYGLALVLVLFNWPWPARQARAMALSIRERDFIFTAVFSGQHLIETLVKEVFPFIADWALANFINAVLVGIAMESGLAVIGLSSNSKATLGTMIYWANQKQAMLMGRWWWIGSPVVTTVLVFVSLFLTMTGYQMYAAKKRGGNV